MAQSGAAMLQLAAAQSAHWLHQSGCPATGMKRVVEAQAAATVVAAARSAGDRGGVAPVVGRAAAVACTASAAAERLQAKVAGDCTAGVFVLQEIDSSSFVAADADSVFSPRSPLMNGISPLLYACMAATADSVCSKLTNAYVPCLATITANRRRAGVD